MILLKLDRPKWRQGGASPRLVLAVAHDGTDYKDDYEERNADTDDRLNAMHVHEDLFVLFGRWRLGGSGMKCRAAWSEFSRDSR